MADEKTEVIRDLMRHANFRDRVRAIAAQKAYAVLKHVTTDELLSPVPDAATIAWAKAAVQEGYDAHTEALLLLAHTQPASVDAAMAATDTTYATQFDAVLNEVVVSQV